MTRIQKTLKITHLPPELRLPSKTKSYLRVHESPSLATKNHPSRLVSSQNSFQCFFKFSIPPIFPENTNLPLALRATLKPFVLVSIHLRLTMNDCGRVPEKRRLTTKSMIFRGGVNKVPKPKQLCNQRKWSQLVDGSQ